ncbi:Dabb family protein [Terriglobus saanensis]|uniref:Stress responsive alpha-beta barrel domain-containing protein n=1 Tax=Terriglobus saanensis (strain ATCC BAA-1853 / DSM 23119 / SP1PR4) TaxID=401053 RepID=E8V871_TERSS|nr:Dabb family protein [Terriglobus saanensis]ADV84053.1 Stress responsive alpha-beta barrel domain-containing protein [Terriglobus saanensis SP1PR4]
MYIHAFAFRWNENVKEEQKVRVKEEILALQGKIPGLLETHVGTNFSGRAHGYHFAAVMKFTDRSALDAYGPHPVHQELVRWLMPLVEPVEMDFEATSSSKPYSS